MFSKKSHWMVTALAVVALTTLLGACSTVPPIQPTAQAPAENTAEQPAEKPADKPKVAMLMAVSCDDSAWGTPACEGLKEVADKYGLEYSISERVAIADAETAIRDYAARGYKLIIGHGYQYGDPINIVAPEYPDVLFAIYAGYAEGDNVIPVDPKNHENGYLAGIVAGYASQSKVVGAIGGFDIPTTVRALEGYCMGAQSVDPAIQCVYAYPGSWDDIQKGSEAAQAMMDAGADVFFHDASLVGVGMLQAATKAGRYGIGFGTCQDDIDPTHILTSALDGIGETMMLIVDKAMDGTLQGGQTMRPSMADGIFSLCPYNDAVTQEAKDAVEAARAKIVSGELVVEEILTPSNQ